MARNPILRAHPDGNCLHAGGHNDAGTSTSQRNRDTVRQLVESVRMDVADIEAFYNCNFSATRTGRLKSYFRSKLQELKSMRFDELDIEDQTDFILLQKYLQRQIRDLETFEKEQQKLRPLIEPFATNLEELLQRRQKVTPTDGKYAAGVLAAACADIRGKYEKVAEETVKPDGKESQYVAYRAVNVINELLLLLQEWLSFYNGYDPMMTWWINAPYEALLEQIQKYSKIVREKLVGIDSEDIDAIVGQPVGSDGLLQSLDSQFIAYTLEELIEIGEREYSWCEAEMIKASQNLGYGTNWKKALEHVKNMYVEPGEQTYLVHELSQEAIAYVKKHDMVTIPPIAEECWRTYMISPERQKVNPFFLGGPYVQVSYPTDTMSHEDKLMSLRGNSWPLSRSTVFHELIPGHHLQFHMIARNRPYRSLFTSSFWMEGWAFYWEFILWNRGFARTPEEKIGMLFWRMHRCARIVFSLKFHMGHMTPQECINYLVDKVGHEKATAEGEVRRSFNGDYSPLYQAGYMLGALQMYALRKEMVESREITEKQFHDTVLKEGEMPIEILRALLQKQHLEPDYKASWRFYDL